MSDTTHRRAVESLPDHLESIDDAKVRCLECNVAGLRPLGHHEDCPHDGPEYEEEIQR